MDEKKPNKNKPKKLSPNAIPDCHSSFGPKNLSNNEANRITRESICTAMLLLMADKDFDRISISELVRKAGVSRQSFYRNYNSKEDIIIEIENSILASFTDSLDNPKYKDNLHVWFCDFFDAVRNNLPLVDILNKSHLTEILFTKFPSLIESYTRGCSPDMHYYLLGGIGALKAITMEWIESGMKESSREMADICVKYDPTGYISAHQDKIKKAVSASK